MIVTCPRCSARYLLPVTSLGPGGRKVKCSNCAESWFQEPDAEELLEETGEEPDSGSFADMVGRAGANGTAADQGFEDIPQSLKTPPEGLPAQFLSLPGLKIRRGGIIGGAFAALLVFFTCLGGLVFLKGPVMSVWPDSTGLYERMGFSVPPPGDGLVFDKIRAFRDEEGGQKILHLEGNIINLTREALRVPHIEASLRNAEGALVDHWAIAPPADEIAGEDMVSFSASYPYPSQDPGKLDVTLRFIRGQPRAVKTGAGGGGSNPAPAVDADIPLSVPAADGEYHSHGDAHPSPEFGPDPALQGQIPGPDPSDQPAVAPALPEASAQ